MLIQELSFDSFNILSWFGWLISIVLKIALLLFDSDWLVNLLFQFSLACRHRDIACINFSCINFSQVAEARIMLASIFITIIYHKSAVSSALVSILLMQLLDQLRILRWEWKDERILVKKTKNSSTIFNSITKSEWKETK